MDRMYSLASHLFGYLAFALAVLAPLTVPQNVLADSGTTCLSGCMNRCSAQCNGDPACIGNCMGPCQAGCNAGTTCGQQCNGDSTCVTACCQSACNGNQTCVTNCNASAIGFFSTLFCSDCTPKPLVYDSLYKKYRPCFQGVCGCFNPVQCRVNPMNTAVCSCPP